MLLGVLQAQLIIHPTFALYKHRRYGDLDNNDCATPMSHVIHVTDCLAKGSAQLDKGVQSQ